MHLYKDCRKPHSPFSSAPIFTSSFCVNWASFRAMCPIHRTLPDPIKPDHRSPFSDMVSGPVSPLERNPVSPKGWKNRESDGVGLGIVAALERLDGRKRLEKIAVGTPIKCVSVPISNGCAGAELGCRTGRRCCSERRVDWYVPGDGGLFDGPQPRAFRPAEFLGYCHLCRKKLDGKDIYMYRGEKAFCSIECRCQQITNDEFQEKCGSEALRSSEMSRSSYTDDRLFFMGITASWQH